MLENYICFEIIFDNPTKQTRGLWQNVIFSISNMTVKKKRNYRYLTTSEKIALKIKTNITFLRNTSSLNETGIKSSLNRTQVKK